MRTREQILATAQDVPAFSNGSEFDFWASEWCTQCKREAPHRNGLTDGGCVLLTVAICDQKTPREWAETELHDYECTEFRPTCGNTRRNTVPRPRPEPAQDGLFPRPDRSPTPSPDSGKTHR